MSPSLIDSLAGLGLVSAAMDLVAKATVVLVLAWLIAAFWPRSSAAVRHRLWSLALCGILILPILCFSLPRWRLPILPVAVESAGGSMIAEERTRISEGGFSLDDASRPGALRPAPGPAAGAVADLRSPPETSRARSACVAIAAVWGLGFLVAALPAVVGMARNEWRRGASRRVADREWLETLGGLSRQLALGRSVELRIGAGPSIPVTWGVLRPVVLLPESSRGWPAPTRRLVLLHELAHVKRFDVLFQLIGRLAAAFYWFHPLAWYALHRLRMECESACDDCVVAAGERRTDYARELVTMARTLVSARLVAAVPMSREGTLESRIRALFDDRRNHGPLRRGPALGLLAGGLALMTGLAVVRPAPSIAGPQNEAPSQPRPAAPAAAVPAVGAGTRRVEPEISTHPITVTGRAVDQAGKPIPGARVYLASERPGSRRLAETIAKEDGRYEFREVPLPIQRVETVVGRGEGVFEVFGQAVGFGFAWRPAQRVSPRTGAANREAADHFDLDLRFSPPAHLSGTIVDDRGKPIPGVRLEIRGCESLVPVDNVIGLGFNALNERDTVPPAIKIRTTDANGKFFFTGLPPDHRFDIDVRAKGFPDRWLFAATTDEPQPDHDGYPVHASGMTLRLATAFDVPIKLILADTGQPAVKAFVQAGGERVNDAKTTDAQGRVTLRLPPGKYRMQNWPARGTPYLVTEGEFVVGARPPDEPIIASLRPAAVFEVTVIDAESGAGVPGIDLWHQALPGGEREAVMFRSWEAETRIAHRDRPRTNERGKLRVLIDPGKHRIGVGWEMRPPPVEVLETGGRVVECREGEITTLKFTVRKGREAAILAH